VDDATKEACRSGDVVPCRVILDAGRPTQAGFAPREVLARACGPECC
jgi:hypothetical protein